MKTLKLFSLIGLVLFGTTITSCKKKGCMDKDSDNYDPDAEKSDGSCSFRYATSVFVATPTNGGYDPIDGPELYVKFAKHTSSAWQLSTQGADSYSASLSVGSIQFTNETWDYEIWDYDSLDPDDLIATGSINPLTQGSAGSITSAGNGISITFNYTLK